MKLYSRKAAESRTIHMKSARLPKRTSFSGKKIGRPFFGSVMTDSPCIRIVVLCLIATQTLQVGEWSHCSSGMPRGHSIFFCICLLPVYVYWVRRHIYLTVLSIPNNTVICSRQQSITMQSINQLTKKGATCTDLLTCLYSLKPADLEVLQALAKKPDATLDQIAKPCKKTAVQSTAAFPNL